MKLFVLRCHAAQRLAWCRGAGRRYSSNNTTGSSAPSHGATKSAVSTETAAAAATSSTCTTVSSVRSTTPGTVRIRRGTDPSAKEMEMDTTITRMMGSDWGDRSKQPVSYAMKLYWGIFIIVLANGAFTYFLGKDEKFLVDQVQKKVDEKLGRVETNEFVIMADQPKTTTTPEEAATTTTTTTSTITTVDSAAPIKKPAPTPTEEAFDLNSSAPPSTSMFASKPVPTTMPFFGAAQTTKTPSKADYERQLAQLRERQARAQHEKRDAASSFRSKDEIDAEIKRIDQQKAHLKQILKKL